MTDEEFIKIIKRHTAELAVGASALRNQGGKGLVSTAREYFKKVDLAAYGLCKTQARFLERLNRDTDDLKEAFPEGAKHWGTARKAMNLFLRDAFYNRFLCDLFRLTQIEKWLEIPLDYDVATSLTTSTHDHLPKWTAIKNLKPDDNTMFQQAAKVVGSRHRLARVHVDLLYWRAQKPQKND
jgi:hypothetical protein